MGTTVGVNKGKKYFRDHQNKLELEIHFNPDAVRLFDLRKP